MDEKDKELLPSTTPQETAIDVATVVASIVPWVGGPVGAVLAGISLNRKIDRVREVLVNMAEQIKTIESDASKEYVKTDEFQELLEKALRQAANERNEDKRRAYASFLASDIKLPSQSYDEKVKILRNLEELQFDHIRMMKALMQKPDYNGIGMIGSVSQTLQKRLPDIPMDRIRDLAQQLTDMRLAQLNNLNITMTAQGAEGLQNTITPYGQRFIGYMVSSS